VVATADATGDAVTATVGLADALAFAEALGLADALAPAEALGLAELAAPPDALAATDGMAEAIGDSDGMTLSLGAGVAHSGGSVNDGSVGRGVSAPPWPNAST
jgi:hypothetical protein